jgi:hypothetical protein
MRILFLLVNTAFFRLFLEAQKKIIDPQGPMYTKVSWLEGWRLKTPFPPAFPSVA